MEVRISWFAMLALVALLYVLVAGLVNPRTRPFIIGLGTLVGLGVLLLLLAKGSAVQVQKRHFQEQNMQAQIQEEKAQSQVRVIPPPPMPSPPKSSATETKRPKMILLTALGQAINRAWKIRALTTTVEAPDPEYRVSRPAEASQSDVPVGPLGQVRSVFLKPKGFRDTLAAPGASGAPDTPQPPAWVNAAPKMEDNCYTMSVPVGPFTTPLECERDLPKKLQAAVTEYADLSLGPEAAAVRLSDDDLKLLVRDRWTEVRPMEIDGGSQEMHSLYAHVVFDVPMQQRIKSEAQRLVIGRRVQGTAVVFGGVLGLLALTWGGLKLATKRQEVKIPMTKTE